MKKLITIISLFIITGCDNQPPTSIDGLRCSKTQLELAEAQYKLCGTSGFFRSYCLKTAMEAHCSIKKSSE